MISTYVAFVGAGFVMASWASRIPQVRDHLGLEPSQLGLVLLALSTGSVLALPLSGPLIARFGARRIVTYMVCQSGIGLCFVAAGYHAGVPVVAFGLFVLGLAVGGWDVAMNVHGALVERHLGRSIMSRFHAGFSVGTVAGALIGAAMVALEVPPSIHVALAALVVVAAIVTNTGSFLSDDGEHDAVADDGTRRSSFASWKERRTLLIGVFVLAFAFAEGVGNDWIAVAMIDDHHTADAVGTLAFAVFLAAMTLGRWFGPGLLDKHGRVAVVRGLALLGIVGSGLFVMSPSPWLAFVGAVAWGLGTSLGFPVGMSAGADEPAFAAGRVSTIASIGYVAFLGGPPLIGFLGDHYSVLKAIAVVTAMFGISALIAPAVRRHDPA
jgi:MFS family permease